MLLTDFQETTKPKRHMSDNLEPKSIGYYVVLFIQNPEASRLEGLLDTAHPFALITVSLLLPKKSFCS